MSGHSNLQDAQLDRIMEMSVEELAASEGLTVEELREEGRKVKERVLEKLAQRFPEFVKKARG
jgi:L-lactate utilization protein LutB